MSSKNELIEIALISFMINGYQKTSLSSIADQLEMTKPALYYYFPNKKALFLACIDAFFRQMNEDANGYKMTGETVKEKLFNLIIKFSGHVKGSVEIVGFNHYYFIFDAIKEVPEVKALLLSSSGTFVESLSLLIQEGIEMGEIKEDIDIEGVLMFIGVLLEGMAISNYLGYFDGCENMVDRILTLTWQSIAK